VTLAGCGGSSGHDAVDASAGGDTGGGSDGGGGGDAGVDGAVADGPPGCGDQRCDAIAAVFVAPTGDDGAPGARDAPLLTIAAGIAAAAAADPARAVFVQAGSYAEAVAMHAGVTVFGGFDASWVRGGSLATEIVAAPPAVTFAASTPRRRAAAPWPCWSPARR